MDERLRICLWMVGGGGFGCVLGGVFGALATGQLHARSGDTAGTRLARNVVENFLQSGQRQPSPTVRAALIGAADGFFFLGGVGLLAGALLGVSGRRADELLAPMVMGGVVLAGGAIFFGTLAYALERPGEELLSAFVCGVLAAVLAGRLGWDYGCVGAAVLGFYVGLFLCRAAIRRYSPRFQPPRVGKTTPPPRFHADTDITGSSPSPSNADFVRKPDSFEEG